MRYLVEAAIQLPWATWLPGPVQSDSGRTARIHLAAVVDCELEDEVLGCDIEDAVLRTEAVVQDRGRLAEETAAMAWAMGGNRLEVAYEDGLLGGTPRLQQRAEFTSEAVLLAEELLGRALLGLEAPRPGTQRESELGQIPQARGASAVSVLHSLDGDLLSSTAQGSLRTHDGQVFGVQGSATTLLDERGLVEKRWWAIAQPSASASSNDLYLQGGLARRLDQGEDPLLELDKGAEVLALQGTAWSLASGATWTPDLVLDLGQERSPWGLSTRATGLVDRRVDHGLTGGAELWVQVDTPLGLGFDLGGAWHAEREHEVFPTDFPVKVREGLVGFHYRPPEDDWAPRLGLSWGASQRRYAYATPESIWIPTLTAELGFEGQLDRLAAGLFVRGRMDAAPTALVLASRREGLDTISLQAGLQVRTELKRWD
jgi:hypothetical protein